MPMFRSALAQVISTVPAALIDSSQRLILLSLGLLASSSAWAVHSRSSHCETETSNWTGAYYYKVIATQPSFGIRGQIVLPHFKQDPARYFHVDHTHLDEPPSWEGTLDVASVYVGATAPHGEVDVGINYEQVHERPNVVVLVDSTTAEAARSRAHRFSLDYSVTPPVLRSPKTTEIAHGWAAIDQQIAALHLTRLRAYVPFWRTDHWNADPGTIFLPGETITLAVTLDRQGSFALTIQSAGGEKIFSKSFTYAPFVSPTGPGFIFKRINSIDQFALLNQGRKVVGNEPGQMPGHHAPAIPTHARAIGGKWNFVSLILADGHTEPLGPPRCRQVRPHDLASKYSAIFNSAGVDPATGGEAIDITP